MKNIFTDHEIPAGEKVLFGVISGFDQGRGCCAKRETIAHLACLTKGTTDKYLADLAKRGYVRIYRKKDLPAHVYVNPAARAAAGFPPLSDSKADLNYNSNPHVIEDEVCLKNKKQETTNSFQEIPVLEETGQEAEEAVVSPSNTNRTEKAAHQQPVENQDLVDDIAHGPLVNALVDLGVVRPVALDLARQHQAGQIRAAVRYVRGYRYEVLNPPGLLRHILDTQTRLPTWCWKDPPRAIERTQEAFEARSAPSVTLGIGAQENARKVAVVMGWADPQDGRPWPQIREGLTPEQVAYCEA